MRKTPNSYHHGDLHSALIRETERMVAANQLEQVSFKTLGKRLGISVSAPYRHFAGKGELLCAVASAAFYRMREEQCAIRCTEGLPPLERFKRMGRAYFRFSVENRDFYRLMFREDLLGDKQTEELLQAREASFGELVQVLQECQESGVIAEGDPMFQALCAWSGLHGVCSLVLDRHVPLDELPEGFIDAFLETTAKGLA